MTALRLHSERCAVSAHREHGALQFTDTCAGPIYKCFESTGYEIKSTRGEPTLRKRDPPESVEWFDLHNKRCKETAHKRGATPPDRPRMCVRCEDNATAPGRNRIERVETL
jgi:hypothetical protein